MQEMDYESQRIFFVSTIFIQLLGVLSIILITVWTTKYLGGFGWQNDPLHEFNYHPLFAVLGLVVLYGNGLLVYRAMREKKKVLLKILHIVILTISFLLTVFSLKTVFDSHDYRPIPIANMYSLHSWIGLGAVILFAVQLVCGFMAFVFPGVKVTLRRSFMPLHKFFGITIFALSVASCQSGITEKAKGSLKKEYQHLPAAAFIANFLGISITIFAILVIYLVVMPQFKRRPLLEEDNFQLYNASS